MEIILIAAMAANRVIGRNNEIPWHIPGDQQRFRKVTWGHPVIMGRRTHESIGRPLPGRRNIIVTRNPCYEAPSCELASSLEDAYFLCQHADRVFNIGGEQLYRQGIEDADMLILTVLARDVPGDVYFPPVSPSDFQLIHTEQFKQPVPYSVQTYRRIWTHSKRHASGNVT